MRFQRVADEAALLGALNEPGAAILSGGTDLLVKIRNGMLAPTLLVDVSRVATLRGIHRSEGALEIGAAATESAILADPDVRAALPLLVSALASLGSAQIRNRGTLGGNLVNASPAADSAVPLLLHDASLDLVGPDGERTVPVESFLLGPGKTDLRPGEFVRTVRIPIPEPGLRPFYHKVGKRKALTIAIASIGALVRVADGRVAEARIAAGSVAPTPLRLRTVETSLSGVDLSEAAIDEARRLAIDAVSPIDDIRATAAYRQHVVGDLVARALKRSPINSD